MPKFKKNTSRFRMKSPLREETTYGATWKGTKRQLKSTKEPTKEMIQNLDDKIAELKKLGKHDAAQVFIDKKSKLMDKTTENGIGKRIAAGGLTGLTRGSMATKKYKY